MYRTRFLTRLSGALLLGIIAASISLAQAPAQQGAVDLEGNPANPLLASPGKVVVLIFLRRDCPVSGRYAPIIQSIGKHYEHDVRFSLVYPDKTDTPQQIRKYLRDYGYDLPALRDPDRVLVKLAHVQITPEVAVFDGSHRLIYDGRIDNWYVDLNRARPAATTHELNDAIETALSGKPVAAREVRGVGCYISDLD
jgi:thiol-disulfide isomerase/thioredoxin